MSFGIRRVSHNKWFFVCVCVCPGGADDHLGRDRAADSDRAAPPRRRADWIRGENRTGAPARGVAVMCHSVRVSLAKNAKYGVRALY